MKLYLLRHGFAYHNLGAQTYGDKAYIMKEYEDAYLTPHGIKQAQDLKNVLNSITFTDIYCSSSSRCIQTCDNCIKTKIIVKLDDTLLEHQGHHICNKRKHKEYINNFISNLNNKYELYNVKDDYIFNKEIDTDVLERIKHFLNDISTKYKYNDKILIVTHHNFLKGLTKYLTGKSYYFDNCELKIIELK
jgi:broad specificity phosphatase PhoE